MDLLDGVTSHTTGTGRLRMHWLQWGPDDGEPVLLVHGNLSTGRFFEHLMPGAPARYRLVAPDMRGFGRTEPLGLDATRGLRDWSDDVHSLVSALGIERPLHLLGWSTGAAAISHYAIDHGGVASLTYVDPVSPYGFGGVRADGTPCADDFAGSGGGTVNPEFVARLRAGDACAESPASPRNVMNTSYWAPGHREPADREDLLVEEILASLVGDSGYPGDSSPSANWPGVAPGRTGILNALSPKYCDWSGVVDLAPKPPVLWTHGSADIVIADGSAWEMGTLGAAGAVPDWPGPDAYPPQPMVTQIRAVLGRYAATGGSVRTEIFEGSGHGPFFDAADRWSEAFFDFLASVGGWVPVSVDVDLSGRTAIVTGGASGIGLACARRLAAAGAHVTVLDLNADAAAAAVAGFGGRALVADLGDPDAVTSLGLSADILVNNAGFQVVSPLQDFPVDQFGAMLRVMVESPFRLIRGCLPGMYERGYGRIVNISSAHGRVASPYKAGYVACKHAIEGLSKVVALEAGPHGVTSNCISPGYVRTPLVEQQIADQAAAHGIPEQDVIGTVLLERTPIKRLAEPAEVAELAAYLCSPAAGYINGASVSIDGGWTAG